MTAPTRAAEELTGEELGAWRGMLRVHSALVRALDAELEAAHDLPLTSYDVLIYLRAARDNFSYDQPQQGETGEFD